MNGRSKRMASGKRYPYPARAPWRLGVWILWHAFLGGAIAPAADVKIEIFFRGLLSEHPSEWAELQVLSPRDSGFPFDVKVPDPPGVIPAQAGVGFGSLVRIGNIPDEITTLRVKQVVRHPPMTLPDGSVATQRVENLILPVRLNSVGVVLDFHFTEAHELVDGRWVMEAYLDDGTLFYMQRFQVLEGAGTPVLPELGSDEGEAMFALSRSRYLDARQHDADDGGALPDAWWAKLEPALNREWDRFRATPSDGLPLWIEDLEGLDAYVRQTGGDMALNVARGAIRGLPEGALVFGGTDFGRFVLEAARLLEGRDDIVLICQHQLVRPAYRAWVRSRFGGVLTLPDEEAVNDAMQHSPREWVPEAVPASGEGLAFVGDSHRVDLGSRVARMMFDANTNQPVFVEERFPLEWMRERMRPGPGLLMRVDREPVEAWTEDEIEADAAQWSEILLTLSGKEKHTAIRPRLLQMRALTRELLAAQGNRPALQRVEADLNRLADPVSAQLFGLAPPGRPVGTSGLQTYRVKRLKRMRK